jgi:hypothetical protein
VYDPGIFRLGEAETTTDHAVRQRFTDFLPDFLLPFGRLISVRSVVQLYPAPKPQIITCADPALADDLACGSVTSRQVLFIESNRPSG